MEKDSNLEAFNAIINSLKSLDKESQSRTLQAAITYLDITLPSPGITSSSPINTAEVKKENVFKTLIPSFSEDRSISPKDFLRDKSPRTDIERVACLAFYLTHYRELPHFKTLDISSLNTEAAQPKFSNSALAVNNAAKAGILVQAIKGSKQISAAGEIFVQLLPDRDAARASLADVRNKRRSRKSTSKTKK